MGVHPEFVWYCVYLQLSLERGFKLNSIVQQVWERYDPVLIGSISLADGQAFLEVSCIYGWLVLYVRLT